VNGWGVRVIALMAVVGSYWIVYQHGRSVERAEAATASAQRDSGDRLAEVLGERGERQEEQRRAAAHEEVREHAQEQRTIAETAAAGADAAGQRLRDEAGKLVASVGCPGQDPAVAARSQAATRAAMVLSDLLARADARAGELAAAYDRARVAGLACEASYDGLVE
jgi:flagellar biosynthesis GTPase FlhF